jgi:chromosome segregation ATPase
MKADALAKEVEEKAAVIASLKKRTGGEVNALEARIAAKDKAIAQWKEKYAQLTDALRQAKTTIRERDTTIATMEDNTRELESELQFATRTRDRYLSENRQMASTAQSILVRYDEKGVFANTIINVEPFTQIKKVELEQLIQDYMDSIDDHTIRDGE